MGLAMEDVRTAIANSNGIGPVGVFDGNDRAVTLGTNGQLQTSRSTMPSARSANGTVVRLGGILDHVGGTQQPPPVGSIASPRCC
jgi:multidrug efflux pump subunit AcrB